MFERRRYPQRLTVSLEVDTIATLQELAAEANASVAGVARECIKRGIAPTREAWREHQAQQRGGGD